MKINTDLSADQKKAMECMRGIAKLRDEMPYMRPLKNGKKGKKVFAEFVEGFVCEAFNLVQCNTINQKGYDATFGENVKIQIKDVTESGPHVGDILEFDYLITVALDKSDFSIAEIGVYPRSVVERNQNNKKEFKGVSKFPEHV